MKMVERFWSKVKKTRGCWLWIAGKNKRGYGWFRDSNGESRLAHRVSWELVNGVVPDGLLVLHTCDNPSCVRPDHLFIGTHRDNVRDMIEKGRAVYVKGEQHGRAKLGEKEVKEIKRKYFEGSVLQLSKFYRVSPSMITRILMNKSWNHLLKPH